MRTRLFVAGLLMAGITVSATANIIGNPGFESTLGDWTTDTTNWAAYNGSSGQSTWQSHSGSYSLIFANFYQDGGYSGTSSFTEQKPGVDAETEYTIEFYSLWDSSFVDNGATAYLKVFWDTDADPYNFGTAAETFTLDLGTASQWQLQSFTVTSGTTAQHAKLEFGFTATGTGGSCYIDDVNMNAVPEPVSSALLGLGIVCIYAARKRMNK